MNDSTQFDRDDEHAIAIVGMACHLPGALNLEQYWQNLRDGVESVRFYTDEELLAAGESPALLANPNYVRAQPFLEKYDYFDAKFWGFSAQDAAVTDPAHRLFFEVAYQSLEHAGHTGFDAEGTVGVFAASGASLYWRDNLKNNRQLMSEMGEFLVRHTGNDMNFLATRFSYELDLRGPSLNVQTACSSSLVSIHLAIQSLLGGECDMAVAGGSTVLLPQQRGYLHQEGEITSPDGHCRPFDAKSAGTVFGSGAGAIVLRRLDDALADGDTVYAVISGSAVNNDGGQKVGFLAPGVDGQAGAIAEAQDLAGVSPADISYVEAHGTGTLVGDPIEFEALHQVFGNAGAGHCRVGSVKSNIGHLGEAAGIASVIKVVLALQHQQLPPTVNYQSPNPDIDLVNSPFRINKGLEHWDALNGQRTAGITALGAGGTNAHIIVKQAPTSNHREPVSNGRQLLVLSAKTKTALRTASQNLAQALSNQPELALADVAYTLQIGRRPYKYRRAIAAANREEAIALLQGQEPSRLAEAEALERSPGLIFMFPGGGAQYAGMGAQLYATQAVYKSAFDTCLATLAPELAEEIRTLVLSSESSDSAASKNLERPSRALPALFATEYALAKTMMAWGAEPTGFVGHSMGEYTAACLAGVFSVADAMKLVSLRGQLFETVPNGGMLSVALTESKLRGYLNGKLDIAAVNAPDFCVASGPVEDIAALQQQFERENIECTRIRINVAAHSAMLDDILQSFRQCCQSIRFQPPHTPFTSNVSGGWISDAQATDPNYWVQHLRGTVRFADNIATVDAQGPQVLVEVGPGQVLSQLAQAATEKTQIVFSAMRHPKEVIADDERALKTVGQLWAAGVTIDWLAFWGDLSCRRVALPSYPFERKAYWIDASVETSLATAEANLNKRSNMGDWFGNLSWTQVSAPTEANLEALASVKTWLIFDDEIGVSDLLVRRLPGQVIRVRRGESFQQLDANNFQLTAADEAQFERLFTLFEERKYVPEQILFLWPVTLASEILCSSKARLDAYEQSMASYFWGLFNVAKVLSKRTETTRLTVVSSDLHSISAASSPEKAPLLGVVNVLPHELPHVSTQSIDVSTAVQRPDALENITDQILQELCVQKAERVVAYRGSERWLRRHESASLQKLDAGAHWSRAGANVLISGGLGGIGLTVAQHFAQLGAKNLLLVSRRQLPEREGWSAWLESHSELDATSITLTKIQNIERLGATVTLLAVDVTDSEGVRKAIAHAERATGAIHGVVHAAGTMNDELILLKSPASASQIMDVKIKGALVLDEVLASHRLDFFTVFSSVSSFLGLPGQVDYTAANAFLDAFSCERARRCAGQSVAVNWNAWRDIGMAVDAHELSGYGATSTAEKMACASEWFDHYRDTADVQRVYSQRYATDHWLLAEHRTKQGAALIPGTGFIELLRAAYVDHLGVDEKALAQGESVFLSDIQFIEAFSVPDGEPRWLHIAVAGGRQGATLSVYSESEDAAVVVAKAAVMASTTPCINLADLRARCTTPRPTRAKFLDQDFMAFGERWGCIESLVSGASEALMTVALSDKYADDFQQLVLHPALLDMAIGGAQFLIEDFNQASDFYVPVGYEKLVLHGPMPKRFFSHVKMAESAQAGFASFNVMLADQDGNCFLEVFGFTMKKVTSAFASGGLAGATGASKSNTALEDILREAITPEEGVEALDRVMSQRQQSQWIVSSVDAKHWLALLDDPTLAQPKGNAIRYVKEVLHDADADADIPRVEQVLKTTGVFATVIVRSFLDSGTDRRLVAFYQRAQGVSVAVAELPALALSVLESDLNPAQFVEVDAFSYLSDGAVDRAQLCDPISDAGTRIPPCSETEIALATLWQEALGDPSIGLGEDFFELGGHSLLLIRLSAKINKTFSINLPVSKLFENPKIENWAELIEGLKSTPAPVERKITRVSRRAHELPNS